MSTFKTTIQKISFKLAPPTNSISASYGQREGAVREVLLVQESSTFELDIVVSGTHEPPCVQMEYLEKYLLTLMSCNVTFLR